ncbi:MAG: type II toxin-antitoxin system VapC family toxin [Promethearchaeota archaeon]
MTNYFLDTNILWWYVVKTSKNHRIVKPFLDDLILNPFNSFTINEFVMIELIHHLVKKKGTEGYRIARKLLHETYPFFKIHYDISHNSDLSRILDLVKQYGMTTTIGGRDASIIHSMAFHGIQEIITCDAGFEEVADITVINPLKMVSEHSG